MVAIYANGNGTVTKYRVTEWRVVDPADSALGDRRPAAPEHDPPDLRREERPAAAQRPPRRGRLTPSPRRAPRSADPQAQDLARDHEALDLAGALADLGELGVAQVALDRVLGHVAVAAVDLDRGIRHA